MIIEVPDDAESMQMGSEVKVFYCSRTHSQISQFVGELRRVKFPLELPDDTTISQPNEKHLLEEEIRHLPLGSRKNLCINTRVSNLGSTTAINERCLELQQKGTPQDHRCTYLPTKENETLVDEFRDYALSKIRDIEDLGDLGKKIGICPYYASRATIKPSEVNHL